MADYAIEVNNLIKRYGRSQTHSPAVDHINFEVHQGEIFGFLKPNGAGKTTTQRMLTTLLAPTAGRILVNGYDLARHAYQAKRQMGLAPEESNVYTELTAWDNLLFTAQLYRTPRNEPATRAQELLKTLLLPFFLFFSFSIKREIGPEVGLARILALTTFFTASSAGPVIIPMERRTRTYARLLVAPMSLLTLLLGKTLVGAFFGLAIAAAPLLVGWLALQVAIADPALLIGAMILDSLAFSAFGLIFASIPIQLVGSIMMLSTLIRWPLLFISGIFVPLGEMDSWARALAYLSPLTYAQDLLNHAVLGAGYLNRWLDLALLPVLLFIFLIPAARLHQRSRMLGY